MAELGDFLRTRRARLQPQDVGLPDYGRRRVPGLRREELAQLAGVSVDYYVRLEQGRDIQPSDSVLDAIACALQLTDDERSHLFTLVRPRRRARRRPSERVRPGVQRLVERIEFPAFVLGRRMDVLAYNAPAAALLGGMRERNMLRYMFFDDGARALYPDWEQVAAEGVAYLRLTAGEDPDDAQLVELIGELSLHSEPFRRLWARHDVKSKSFGVKTFEHPQVGPLELDYESLKLPDADQTLVTYTAAPGSPSETALGLLAQLGREEDRGGVGDDDRVFEVR
ncbi:helix-turn-helix transcriptional regulator [Solirubrobacter ginsenosidimutans]|uniref:Helix-turn-helix transcriptional regulator n=1 Tax=Solirubrobacter ginsenosidimutans TaxID=490573 RepID=A0A9X3MXQ8_9ACTN|nr:helix-turn-helix transcriptional regulator [Solirubrobacter ginsenosidimutans]MDA0164674.1 helix-turn-helix transcriptional regulator [Solirubrobacter ginsenosidimutans]